MGKLQVFEVVFDGKQDGDLFQPGDMVEGYLRIVLNEVKNDIRGITIKFVGKGKTDFYIYNAGTKGSDHYYCREIYFKEKKLILGKHKEDTSGEKVHLDAGEHKFPFSFQIPDKPLPAPFEGSNGSIRYKVCAKIDRPWKFNHNTQKLFNLPGPRLDLNSTPGAQTPCKHDDEKTVCCLCCSSQIKMTGQTDKAGYVAGETIWVSGYVDNLSSRRVGELKVSLKQKVKCTGKCYGKGHSRTRTNTKTLVEITSTDSAASLEKTPLLIPTCPPTNDVGQGPCMIIDIGYYVHFEANISGTPLNADVKLPITIGTIPLASAYAGGVVSQQPSAPVDASTLPPPSYEVAMGGLQEIKPKGGHDYTFGKLMYAPMYPSYNFENPPNQI